MGEGGEGRWMDGQTDMLLGRWAMLCPHLFCGTLQQNAGSLIPSHARFFKVPRAPQSMKGAEKRVGDPVGS